MDISSRALWTLIHGMGFGGLYLLACSGAIVELWRRYAPSSHAPIGAGDRRFVEIYFAIMAVLAWLAVLTGAYVVYPWYRAVPPPGTTDLAAFPQRLLLSRPFHCRVALPRHGVERACRMAGADFHHHDLGRAGALWVQP